MNEQAYLTYRFDLGNIPILGTIRSSPNTLPMILIGKQLLRDYVRDHPETKSALDTLEQELEDGCWKTPHELKGDYPRASIIGGKHVVFDICGNKHRLWVQVTYKNQSVATIKIGTHKEYDGWKIKA